MEKIKQTNSETKIVIGEVRLKIKKSIHSIKNKESFDNTDYIELVIPTNELKIVQKIQKAINTSIEKGILAHHDDLDSIEIKLPIKYAHSDNNHILRVKISRFSRFVNSDKSLISNLKNLYSGCLVRASIYFYPFNNDSEKGINAELSTLEKIKDGDIYR